MYGPAIASSKLLPARTFVELSGGGKLHFDELRLVCISLLRLRIRFVEDWRLGEGERFRRRYRRGVDWFDVSSVEG